MPECQERSRIDAFAAHDGIVQLLHKHGLGAKVCRDAKRPYLLLYPDGVFWAPVYLTPDGLLAFTHDHNCPNDQQFNPADAVAVQEVLSIARMCRTQVKCLGCPWHS